MVQTIDRTFERATALKHHKRLLTVARTQLPLNTAEAAFHRATAADYEGEQIIRVRSSTEDTPIPEDLQQDPVFCFQVYSTVPLGFDVDLPPSSAFFEARTDL